MQTTNSIGLACWRRQLGQLWKIVSSFFGMINKWTIAEVKLQFTLNTLVGFELVAGKHQRNLHLIDLN